MQTQQPNHSSQATQPLKVAAAPTSPKVWTKPTFERVPLNNALAGVGVGEDSNAYSS